MILFVGNFLTIHGYNPTFMELLANDLINKYNIICVSNKKNIIIRFMDMCFQFYKNINQIELVVIDTYSTNAYYFALLVSLLSKIHTKPYVLILSGGGLEKRYKKSVTLGIILKYSSNNICPSKYLFNIFNNNYNKISYIPNYIDIDIYPLARKSFVNPNILWVRSFHEIYNPQMAILVINEIRKKYPNSKLCMVGPTKDNSKKYIKKLIRKYKLENNVIITGKLSKEDWIKLSTDYNIFINTTNYDNHPVTLLEAMALGLPIVSTNVGGIPAFLTHNKTAKLVEIGDYNSMVSCIIEYLLNEEERMDIIANARSSIEDDYDKEKIISKWYDVISNNLN